MSVVYDDWLGEDWLPNGGRRCRHVPTRAVFDLWFDPNGEVQAVLREGTASTALFEQAKGYYRVFRAINPAHQPQGRMTEES